MIASRLVFVNRALALALVSLCGATPLSAQREPWMLGPFAKPRAGNPIIAPNSSSTFRSPMNDSVVHWEEYATFNPAAVVHNGKIYLLYRAEDASGKKEIGFHTSRLGLAESGDGLHFTRRAAPVLYPDKDAQRANEWPGGVEDPRVVQTEDGTFILTYTQWNRDVPRLAVATSQDLLHWTKHGPAFARAAAGKYLKTESKSGAILTRVVDGRVVAAKVKNKYWMYWGVPKLGIATSDNLLDWTPLETTDGNPLYVLSPRRGYFDAWLVEAGPPALLTEHGIVVLYNAGNDREKGDTTLATGVYTGGQALFDASDPTRLIARSPRPFITPTESYERTGQYQRGTTFLEGLVPFKGRWFLYYGTADSRVGVAVAPISSGSRPASASSYDVFAIRYASIPNFPVRALIADADSGRRLDIAMMVWLLKGKGRNVLVDAGFHRPDLVSRWKPADYLEPDVAVARAGTRAAEVTDVIVTHVHWDHFDGVDLFPNATIWIQREEYEHHVDSAGRALDRAIDGPDAMLLARLRRAGRVRLVDGDAREIIPGITVYTGGKHTYQSQYAAVRTSAGTVVLASDNAYLYENFDRHVPIAQTLDTASNLRAQDRMRTLAASARLIVPGHDPAVFERFPLMQSGVARIR